MLNMFFGDHAIWFGVPALLGTALFAVKVVLMLIGADHGEMGDLHDIAGMNVDTGDSVGAFKALSIQGVIAFIMGFGWAGLAALHSTNWSLPILMIAAIGGGLATAWVLATTMRAMMEFQSSGNVNIQSTVGLEGTVYVGVPGNAAGRGQVQVVVDGRQRIYNAVSHGGELPTGTRVRVMVANGDNTITVTAI